MALLPGQVLINRYRIVKLVGQGGFGAVYRAWDTTLHVPVAVKENLDTSAEAQHQFEREALLLAPLRHPNLPRVSDHFALPGQGQYLVMDFVEGNSLEALMVERGGPLSEAEALPWIQQVAEALDYLHSQKPPIIHRDIKPQNIIITANGRAVLVDFGISKVYDPTTATTAAARAVTSGYSPPEQYGSGKTDARSDVYALGATLYALLTGQQPPESIDLLAGTATLMPLRLANPGVKPATENAIAEAMTLSASRRLGGVGAFREALAGAAAPPIGPTVVVTPHVVPQRRSVPVWAVVVPLVLVVLAVAGIGVAAWLGRDDNDTVQTTPSTMEAQIVVVTATLEPAPVIASADNTLTKTPPPPTDEPLLPTVAPTVTPVVIETVPTVGLTPPLHCPGALPSRLESGDTARVVNFQLNVRSGPGTSNPIVRRLDVGRTAEVLDGPVCDDGQLWFYILSETIRPRDGSQPYQAEGWSVEESDGEYYLEPVN